MNYQIKRGSTVIFESDISGTREEAMMGVDVVNVSFATYEYIDFLKGDTMMVDGMQFTLSQQSDFQRAIETEGLYRYSLKFLSENYRLGDIGVFAADDEGNLTEYDCFFTGTAEKALDLILLNANRVSSGWTKGTVDESETFDFDFTSDNCLTALAKVAERAKTEIWFSAKAINLTKIGSDSGLSFRYGKGRGLTGITRKTLDNKVVTRLWVYGSKQNLPADYPGLSKRLRMPAGQLYIEDTAKVEKYGLIEDTFVTDDVFPKRTCTVTAVDDALSFRDSSIDFDISSNLVDGVSAKVKFISGDLAGWQFEIKEGGYNHALKKITINVNKDEKAIEVPSESGLKPSVGDRFIFLDVIAPSIDISNAETELLERGTAEYLENCDPHEQFEAAADRIYLRANDVHIGLGDYVNIAEPDAGINRDLRVISKTTNLQDPYDVTPTLGDNVSVSPIVKQLITSSNIQKAVRNAKLSDVARQRLMWRTTTELTTMVDTLRAEMLLIMIDGGAYETSIVSEVSKNRFTTTAGTIQHADYIENGGEWNVAALDVEIFSENPYYVYIRANRGNTSAVMVLSAVKIAVESDPLYYFFPLGIISSIINDSRVFTSTKGYTLITGDNIRTGRLVSNDGETFIDLETGEIRGVFTFTSGESVAETISAAEASAKGYADTLKASTDAEIEGLGSAFTGLGSYIDGAFSDGLVSQAEATAIKNQIKLVDNEKSDVDNRYSQIYGNSDLSGTPKTDLAAAKAGYDTAYSDLVSAITSAVASGSIDASGIADVNSKFTAYRSAIGTLSAKLNIAISSIAQTKATGALNSAKTYSDTQIAAVSSDIADVDTRVDNLGTYVDGAFSDGIIEQSEAVAIEKYLNSISSEMADIDSRYTTIYGNPMLTGSTKTALASAKSAFDTEYSDLASTIGTAIADGSVTSAEKSAVYAKFTAYRTALASLSAALTESVSFISQAIADAAASPIQDFLDNVLPSQLSSLQNQIDGAIESFFYNYDPTTSNAPASSWTTTAQKERHANDTFTNTVTGGSWRWVFDGSAWGWAAITDTATQQALYLAGLAKDTADSKRRTFVSTPTTPYDVGDLWTQGPSGDLMRCSTQRLSGSYNSADWTLASKYTDDSAVNTLAAGLGDMAYQDVVEKAKLGSTIISGGYIKNELIETDSLVAKNVKTKPTGRRLEIIGDENSLKFYNSNGRLAIELKETDGVVAFNVYDTYGNFIYQLGQNGAGSTLPPPSAPPIFHYEGYSTTSAIDAESQVLGGAHIYTGDIVYNAADNKYYYDWWGSYPFTFDSLAPDGWYSDGDVSGVTATIQLIGGEPQ